MNKIHLVVCATAFFLGCGSGESAVVLPPVEGDPAYAVISTDFASTAVSLLDDTGAVVADAWLTSGSTWPTLVAALSGDVALPTRQIGDGSLIVIDRFNTDVVSRFDMPTGALFGQVRVQGSSSVAAFSSNPHDVVVWSEDSAWVTRFDPSFESNPAPDVAGNDLYEFNPTTMTLEDGRVDLSEFDEEVGGVTAYARPDRIVRLGEFLLVGLGGYSADFTQATPGKVAVVDVAAREATGFSLPGVRGCGFVSPVPGRDDQAVVGCLGASTTFDPAEQRMSAGIFIVAVDSEGEPSIVRSWLPSSDPSAPNATGNIVALSDREVLGVAAGDFATIGDEAFVVDLETGEVAPVLAVEDSFVVGQGAYDEEGALLLVPVSTEGVRVYGRSDEGFELLDTVIVSGAPLGPVFVSWLR